MNFKELEKTNELSESVLQQFYANYFQARRNGESFKQALFSACYNSNGTKKFNLELDIPWFVGNEVTAYNALLTFNGFKRLINKGYIEISLYDNKIDDNNILTS